MKGRSILEAGRNMEGEKKALAEQQISGWKNAFAP